MRLTTKDDINIYKNEEGEKVCSIILTEDRGYKTPLDIKITYKDHIELFKLLNLMFP
ncbi:hypothetical protein [Clostridium butyricum]|uniref:hypothetical protein n=1 Tax=Clostridium butyricum TaxID=1492 RepID=UPI0022E4EBF0|nr:hypothetical protein [Clostridium butyricum]